MHELVLAVPATDLPGTHELLASVTGLVTEAGMESLLPECSRLESLLRQPGFRVAVAGEFSRGKSTLLNRLLGQELLPVGDLPTTALLTAIRFGTGSVLWHVRPGQVPQPHVLAPEALERFCADGSGHGPDDSLELELPYSWLGESSLELLDTPGAGDLVGPRATQTAAALAGCDAVLVAVSATMAMSLTERAFVEEHVLARSVPRVAVVLTRLDQVPSTERPALLAYVRERLREWAPEAELWCGHHSDGIPEGSGFSAQGAEAIRQRLRSWARDGTHVRLRQLQFLMQLQALSQLLRQSLRSALEAARSATQRQQESTQAVEPSRQEARMNWEDVRLEMEQRQLEVCAWFEQELNRARERVQDELAFQLGRARDPARWWNTDLPYLLRRELVKLGAGLTETLATRVTRETKWLRSQLRKRCSWSFRPGDDVPDTPIDLSGQSQADLKEVEAWNYRALTRLGAVGALALAAPVIGIPGLLAGAVSMVLTEKLHRGHLEQRQQALSGRLVGVIDQAFAGALDVIRRHVEDVYRNLLEQTRRQEELWLSAERKALARANSISPDELPRLEDLVQRTSDVASALEGLIQGVRP